MTNDELYKTLRKAKESRAKDLSLKQCNIDNLPIEIGELTELETLNLRDNSLSSLPSEIGNLERLRRLSLSKNSLRQLPPQIGNLKSLQELFVGGNKLTSLPPEIGRLQNLKSLVVAKNELVSIPTEICNLSSLVTLNANANKIRLLPHEIIKLIRLRDLMVLGNPLLPPLDDVAEKGTYAVMSYFLGLQHSDDRDNISRQRVAVRKELRVGLHQYLIYFQDFVATAKGKDIDFNVVPVSDGLELQFRTESPEDLESIGRYLQEYVALIGQHLDSLYVKVESDISETEKQMLLVELRSQVRNLQTAVEIRNVKIEYLQNDLAFARRLLVTQAMHPAPISIDVKANARAVAEAKIDVRVEIANLQESVRELALELYAVDPSLNPELEEVNTELAEVADDIENPSELDPSLFNRIGKLLKELSDPGSKYGRVIESTKNGFRLLQKAGNAYNTIAEWLGLPQIPRTFLKID